MILQQYSILYQFKHKQIKVMKTEKNINPQSTTRNEDTKQTNNPAVTTGTSHLNQETTKTPGQEEKEPWKNPDPTKPEKKQEIYAGKKDPTTTKREEDYENEGATDEDIDHRPEAKYTGTPDSRGKEDNDIEREHKPNDQINP